MELTYRTVNGVQIAIEPLMYHGGSIRQYKLNSCRVSLRRHSFSQKAEMFTARIDRWKQKVYNSER